MRKKMKKESTHSKAFDFLMARKTKAELTLKNYKDTMFLTKAQNTQAKKWWHERIIIYEYLLFLMETKT